MFEERKEILIEQLDAMRTRRIAQLGAKFNPQEDDYYSIIVLMSKMKRENIDTIGPRIIYHIIDGYSIEEKLADRLILFIRSYVPL